jgi:hypothetical protein
MEILTAYNLVVTHTDHMQTGFPVGTDQKPAIIRVFDRTPRIDATLARLAEMVHERHDPHWIALHLRNRGTIKATDLMPIFMVPFLTTPLGRPLPGLIVMPDAGVALEIANEGGRTVDQLMYMTVLQSQMLPPQEAAATGGSNQAIQLLSRTALSLGGTIQQYEIK